MTSAMSMVVHKKLSINAIMYLIHHIFLPPKLPQGDDYDSRLETVLLNITLESLVKFKSHVTDGQKNTVDSVIDMVTNLRNVRDSSSPDGITSEEALRNALRDLRKKGGTIPLHIRAQNAGILMSKTDNSINFEAFELSPYNEAVLTTKGRLQRIFPGLAFSLSVDVFEEPNFQTMVACALAKMSYQPAVETSPRVRKAGQMLEENRDTVHPNVVTEFFMGMLRGFNKPADVVRIRKNTREEVMYNDSFLPWRRSPLWLLLRVVMQLGFTRSAAAASDISLNIYKMFMAFLMGCVLDLSLQSSLHVDLLHAMNAKITRRLLKLDSIPRPLLDHIWNLVHRSAEQIQTTWSALVQHSGPCYEPHGLESLDFDRDAFVSLPGLDEHIKSLCRRQKVNSFVEFQPESTLDKWGEDFPVNINLQDGDYKSYNLRALESWVALDLSRWLQNNKRNTTTCGKLGSLMKNYHAAASPFYSGNPEALSVMLLTIFELWIACDESAVSICGLLEEYDAGIPTGLLQSLVLPFKCQMQRLYRVERYLERRRSRVRLPAPHVFRDFGLRDCFSVRYFNQNPKYKALREKIETRATQDRERKCEELRQKRAKYNSLIERYEQGECEYRDVIIDPYSGFSQPEHKGDCSRCRHRAEANNLTIEVHEWPLPKDSLHARSVVFELQVPGFFGHWRDTALFLLTDVLKFEHSSTEKPRASYPLHEHDQISHLFRSFGSVQRIGLLSETKPHVRTHRRGIKVSPAARESDICRNSGLQYKYHDSSMGVFVENFCATDKIPRGLPYNLPARSASIQRFLYRPETIPNGLTPNTVIASQSGCPEHMSLNEYKALCAVLCGCQTQWHNVLLQLTAPSINFRKVETALVILQSIYQSGPSRNQSVLRVSHDILQDEHFACRLLESLNVALGRIKENWENSQALSTFISLGTRLLSLTASNKIRGRCLDYLSSTRAVAFGWVDLLRDKMHRATTESHRAELTSKAVEIALICIDSFNVDQIYLGDIFAEGKFVSVFLKSSIVIQEGKHASAAASNPMIQLLHQRWQWLAYRAYPVLATRILEQRRPLDDAVKDSWSAYQAGNSWKTVSEDFDYWLVSRTKSSNPLVVHYNLLTGEILANGLPLSRLPAKYERHPAYHALFGHIALEVMPTDVPGMQFSGKKEFAGYTFHIGLSSIAGAPATQDPDFSVQAVKNSRNYEIIPSRLLSGVFPDHFVNNFVHWYDMTDDFLEFRPTGDPWTSSKNNWRLMRADSRWRLINHEAFLIGVQSDTTAQLSRILSPLENPNRIHISYSHVSSSLEVEIPRLQLAFHLVAGDVSLRSRQFRDMVVDQDQSLGTLVGLRDKLLLKHKDGSRHVIIPEGHVTFKRKGFHVAVAIDKNCSAKAHLYSVNEQIGALHDNGSLQSKLYLCYLHALTSFCLPDPLIHRTGTEQALSILESAAIRSFDVLTQGNLGILRHIAHLTPARRFYPANERVMQTVKWSAQLSFMTQHGKFYDLVRSIFKLAGKTEMFYPDSYIQPPILHEIDSDLSKRDRIRTSIFRTSGFGAEDHTVEYDAPYKSRDMGHDSERGRRVSIVSAMIYHRRTSLHFKIHSSLETSLWRFLSESQYIFGLNHSVSPLELMYDASLLEDSSLFAPQYWSCLHRMLSSVDKFRVMAWISTLAFAPSADMNIIQTLASFYLLREVMQTSPPNTDTLDLTQGADLNEKQLRALIQPACRSIYSCPEAKLCRSSGESARAFKARQHHQFSSNQKTALESFVKALVAQWPCENPVAPAGYSFTALNLRVDITKAMKDVEQKFKVWFENYRFEGYLGRVVSTLRRQVVDPVQILPFTADIPILKHQMQSGFISSEQIFSGDAPLIPSHSSEDLSVLVSTSIGADQAAPRLEALVESLEATANTDFEKNYAKDLRGSLRSLCEFGQEYNLQSEGDILNEVLPSHLRRCKDHVDRTYSIIYSAVTDIKNLGNLSAIYATSNQRPRVCPAFILQHLARGRWKSLRNDWRSCIVRYGLALAELQRAQRLVNISDSRADLLKELLNPGHTNWDPIEYPESLLLEIESGITIRDVQEQVAKQMRDPESGKNAVMQLNMGEGKSSVIVPIVAAALADGSRLVRVIVAKPQSRQMFQMLVSKLGGLLDRQVYRMPFSRALKPGTAEADAIGSLCRECMSNGGILLVQPEHILSFKLMGLECLISGKASVGRSLLEIQAFLEAKSRDIVDESDENFSVKFELVYTMGMQQPTEFSPERWIYIHQVLDIVRDVIPMVVKKFPNSIEVHAHLEGSFPRTRILQDDAQRELFRLVAEHICEAGRLRGFPIFRQPKDVRQAVLRYITEPDLTDSEISNVETEGAGGFWVDSKNTLLLLRGLVAGGVLLFSFRQKRWRVNYGLDASRRPRTKLAVPYRAKDNPTPRSEFSHPDVVIVLTSLSYYYGGLENDDLFLSFEHLIKSDQADVEYEKWTNDAPKLRSDFHLLTSINLKDSFQCIEHIFPHLRYAKSTIDYFLAHIVFPKEMKEFPHKLSASGWDMGQQKAHVTTGFSGTNDSRKTLPLQMTHLDLPKQNHTNALVLEHLLRPKNSVFLMQPPRKIFKSDADLLLTMVAEMEPPVQVILDVGAQILELSNFEVAKEWLDMMPSHGHTQAVVYFDDGDELCVLDRRGYTEPLQTSAFARKLDMCLIFLDEAHTRGTDLKLPEHYRAAVTLGPNLTKDRLVQACMRMRKLGKEQSVVFCVPEEIKMRLLSRRPKHPNAPVDVSGVLSWAISETCLEMRRNMALWASQGQRYEHQCTLWAQTRTSDGTEVSKSQAEWFLENESQSLEARYRPKFGMQKDPTTYAGENCNLKRIAERCREFDSLGLNSATLQEEQERELSPETEQERQIQRPVPAEAAAHRIHPDVTTFVQTGVLVNNSKAYVTAFETLRSTSAAVHLDVSQFPKELLVTADFARTVKTSGKVFISDEYQRPVQWILTSTVSHSLGDNTIQHMMIISPYEAEGLISVVKESKAVALHLYAPRITLGVRALDGLDLFTVPERVGTWRLPRPLILQLVLFSGQLYLRSYNEYIEMCKFLGLAWEKTAEGMVVTADGFIVRGDNGHGGRGGFTDSPVKFLKVFLSKIRRNCEGINKTHMGMMLDGSLLYQSEFDNPV